MQFLYEPCLPTGAQIIDMMLLVVDVMKGMQTQTAECLVIGQITCHTMIIVLNKIDQIPLDRRESVIGKVRIWHYFQQIYIIW